MKRRNLLLFGGTTEGRILCKQLADLYDITVCVATDYGEEVLDDIPSVCVRTGRLKKEEIFVLCADADCVLDATHPYATEVSRYIRTAVQARMKNGEILGRDFDYFRILRKASETNQGAMVVPSVRDAADLVQGLSGNILLTTGSKDLEAFSAVSRDRLYVRVLPTPDSVEACMRQKIARSHIIAMQGPFSAELNLALIHQFHIRCMVSKDGGKEGGFYEKAAAAAKENLPLIVIARQEEEGRTVEEVLDKLRHAME